MKNLFNWLCLLAIIVLLLMASCTTQKHISSTVTTVDSTVIKDYEQTIWLLKQENARLTAEIHELQYAGVTFDTSGQNPVFIIDSSYNGNEAALMAMLDDYRNKVKIYADGSIEAAGKLKAAYFTRDKLSRFITELQRINDSLRLVKNKVITEVKTDTVIKEKYVKRSFLNFWWLLLMGIVGGYYLRGRFGKIFGII